MKNLYLTSLCFLLLSFSPDPPTKIVFFGDSITQAGVSGRGYIVQLNEMIKDKKGSFELIGAGIGGNKVYDLFLRMEDDVLAKNPDVVFVYIGVNDIWHKNTYGTGTDADKFEKFYQAIINKLKSKNIKVILCTPAVIGERNDSSNPQDGDLNHYSNVIRKIARDSKCDLVDLRATFQNYVKSNNPENVDKGILTSDRVHLNEKGNKLVAEQMLKLIMP